MTSPSGDPELKGRVTLLRDAFLTTGVQSIESAVGIATGVLIARALGPSDYGHYAFAVWLCGWMLLASNNGLNLSAIRFIAEFRGSQDVSLSEAVGTTILRWQMLCTVFILTSFVLVTMIGPIDDWPGTFSWLLIGSLMAVTTRARFWLLAAIAKGHERYEPERYAILIMVAVNLVAIGLWWWFDRTVDVAFGIYALTGLVCYLVAARLFKTFGIKPGNTVLPASVRARLIRAVLSSGFLVMIGLLSGRTLEILLLKAYWSPETIAYFVIAGTLTKGAVDLFTAGIATVLLPVMARAFGHSGSSRVGDMMAESIRYYWFIGLMIAGLGVVVTRGAVTLLYGGVYEAAIPTITYSLVIAGLASFGGALAAFQTASDFQNDRIWTGLATLGVNLVAAFALVPHWGLPGAIVSLAVTRACGAVIQLLVVRRRTPVRIKWFVLMRLTTAAVLACGLAYVVESTMTSRFSFVLSALVFVTGLVLASVLLRCWYVRDYGLAAEVIGHLGPAGGKLARSCDQLGRRFAI